MARQVDRKGHSRFWDESEARRSDIGTPGYWDTLEANCSSWATEMSGSCELWVKAAAALPQWTSEYRERSASSLLASEGLPQFCGKSASSIRSKCERDGDPKQVWPSGGAPIPEINDLVRVRVICNFLDGVVFLADKFEQLASGLECPIDRVPIGKIEGYFAQHLYVDYDLLYRIGGGADKCRVRCEIQIATQLSTRMWEESHPLYARWRGRKDAKKDWQWDAHDPRFLARQLGHMMHLADGLLVQLRDIGAKDGDDHGKT